MSDFSSGSPIRSQVPGQVSYDDIIVKIGDATNPATQQIAIGIDGSVNVTDNGGSLTVDAINLDIRDLTSTTDSVKVLQATHDDLNANANIQVADTDVSNTNPVPISDAGGSLTVDGTVTVNSTNLDIRDLVFATDKVDVTGSTVALDAGTLAALESITVQNGAGIAAVNIQDGGNSITVDGAVTVSSTDLDIRDLVFATDKVDVSGSAVTAVVTANNLDIRDLTHVSDSIKIGDGTDFLAVNSDGSINVIPQEDPGTEVVNYDTTASVAAGSSDNHDHVFTNAGRLYQVLASASGKLKVEIQIETGAATAVFNTVCVRFNSSAAPDCDMELSKYAAIPAGARVRVIRTNRDIISQDVYSTIVGIEQ